MKDKTTGRVVGGAVIAAGIAKVIYEGRLTIGTFITLCSGALMLAELGEEESPQPLLRVEVVNQEGDA